MTDHRHDDHDEATCPYHGLFPANMEAFALAVELTQRLGPPELDFDRRVVAWQDGHGTDHYLSVEVALGHGRPIVEVVGESEGADMARGLCLRLGVSSLDAEGRHIAGPKPAADPWADERERAIASLEAAADEPSPGKPH